MQLSGKQRKRRDNRKRQITLARRPDTWFQTAGPRSSFDHRHGKQSYRYLIKRTPVIDKDNQQRPDCASTPTTSWSRSAATRRC